MNLNSFCYKNLSRVEWDLFMHVDHNAIGLRTRAISQYNENDLFIENMPPIPITVVQHLRKPEDFANPEKLEIDMHVQEKLEFRLKRRFKRNQIFNEAQTIDQNVLEYIRNKTITKPRYYNTRDTFDFNFNKGTLNLIEGDEHDSLAYVWDSSSIQFSRLQSDTLNKLYSIRNDSKPMPNELMIKTDSKFAAVRYPTYVDIFEAPNYDNLSKKLNIQPIDSVKNNKEIVASSLQNKYLTTVNAKHRLCRYDLEHKFEHFTIKLDNYFVDSISPISISDHVVANSRDNFVTLTTKQSYSVIDCRVKKNYSMSKLFTHKNHMLFSCEKIMNHTPSLLDKNIVYISSSHLLYAFDHRNLKEPVIHWTHRLTKPAFMLKTELYGKKEVICVSSHRADDFALFNYSPSCINYNAFKPTSLRSVHYNFKEKGLFLLSDVIPERTEANITGITLQCDPINHKIYVYTQNIYSDIFKYDVKCQNSRKENVNYQALTETYQNFESFLTDKRDPNKFMSDIDRINHGRMHVDDIVRVEGISKILTGEKMSVTDIDMLEPEKFSIPEPSWKINIYDAKQYQDLLASEIMQVWDDIDIEETKPAIFAAALDASKNENEKGLDKVSLWLKNNEATQNSIVNESMDILDNTIFTQDMSTQATAAAISTPALRSARKKPRLAGF